MFRPGEKVCVSHNKFGYHSIPLEEVLEKDMVTLVPTEKSCEDRGIVWGPENFEKVFTDNLTMVALNPIKGWREDANCTAFRSFLIEMDTGDLKHQLEYIKTLGLPYSACVFSGNKSLHFLVTVDQDFPDEETYRIFSEWILNICTLADQLTKNPSRGIRIPGAHRDVDKKQRLVEIRGVTKLQDLADWLKLRPECRPKKHEKKVPKDSIDAYNVKRWVRDKLRKGLDSSKSRNAQWYAIAYEFALSGYSEDDTLAFLDQYFTPDRTFKAKEWRTTIRSAFKHVNSGR